MVPYRKEKLLTDDAFACLDMQSVGRPVRPQVGCPAVVLEHVLDANFDALDDRGRRFVLCRGPRTDEKRCNKREDAEHWRPIIYGARARDASLLYFGPSQTADPHENLTGE